MKQSSSNLIEHLLKIKAIKLAPKEPFTWASGMKSPIYCDNRITLSYPEVRQIIVESFVDMANDLEDFSHVVGVATAGIPHGMLLAQALNKPFAYVRSKPKEHGRQNQIEGKIEEGSKILLIEDLVSTGKSSLEAANALLEIPVEVIATFAIFSYGFDISADRFAKAQIPLKTITNYSELIKKAKDSNYITDEEGAILSDWNKDPQNWFNKNFN